MTSPADAKRVGHTPGPCSIVAQARALNRRWVLHKMFGEYSKEHLRNRRDGLMRIARCKRDTLAALALATSSGDGE